MSDYPPCDRCQDRDGTDYDGQFHLCTKCSGDLRQELFLWELANRRTERPIRTFEVLRVGQAWRKVSRRPEVVAGRLTGAIKEIQIDVAKRTFYRLIDRVTGATERYRGDAVSTNLQSLLAHATDRMVIEEFDAWVALKEGEI